MKHIYGFLECDKIDELARDISINGRTLKNPSLIFDPSRRGGLNKKHPFVVSLFRIPYTWLEIVLNRVNDQNFSNVKIEDHAKNIFDSFKNFMNEKLDVQNILYTWRSKKDQENLNFIADSNIESLKINKEFLDIDEEVIKNSSSESHNNTFNNEITYEIDFHYNNAEKTDYQVLFYKNRIDIKINLAYDTIEQFLLIEEIENEDGDKDYHYDINNELCLVAIMAVLKDAIIYINARNIIMSDSHQTISSIDNLNEIMNIFGESSLKCSPCIRSICGEVKQHCGGTQRF